METKKLDPRGADPKVSAPRAEPTISNLIIPRRELLTGSALFLVGSASGCCKPLPGLLRTQFMADFTAAFIGDPTKIKDPAPPPALDPWPDPTRIWPKPHQTRPDIVTDYLTFVNVLMTVGYVMVQPPPAGPSTLAAQIAAFLQSKNWPTVDPVPTQYQGELPTVHLVEISVILDRLLQAINSFNPENGAGGGPSGWPPH